MSKSEKPGIDIRPGGADLVPAMARLHAASFDEAWGEAALGEILAMPGVFVLQARHAAARSGGSDRLSGFVITRMAADEAEILTLAVDSPERGQGLGRMLMEAAAARARAFGAVSLFLEVAEDNLPAIALYERLGFATVGTRPDYYRRGAAHITARAMRLDLGETFVSKRL
jgi:ribosomal-protein-alanine N-acetyltransferase